MKALVIPRLLPLVFIVGCATGPGENGGKVQPKGATTDTATQQDKLSPGSEPLVQGTVAAQSTTLAHLEATITALVPEAVTGAPSTATVIPLPPQRSASVATPVSSRAAGAVAAADLARYVHPSGLWSVQYPHQLLQREGLTDNIILFISTDRTTFAAVDTYLLVGDEYGQAGEGLRARAQRTLNQIYGKQVTLTGTIPDPQDPWEVGVTFTTDLGSAGQAVYTQGGREQGDFRVYGFVYGHKQELESMMRPMLEAVKATLIFTG